MNTQRDSMFQLRLSGTALTPEGTREGTGQGNPHHRRVPHRRAAPGVLIRAGQGTAFLLDLAHFGPVAPMRAAWVINVRCGSNSVGSMVSVTVLIARRASMTCCARYQDSGSVAVAAWWPGHCDQLPQRVGGDTPSGNLTSYPAS